MPNDLELLQGVWTVTALEVDGQLTPTETVNETRIEIAGDRFTTTGMGAVYSGTLSIDAAAKPRQLDMKFDAGPEAGNLNRAIYELKGGTWKLCIATRGDARPASFATHAGSGFALETLKRPSKKAAAKPAKKAGAASPSSEPGAPMPATEIEGEWRMVSGNMNGVEMDDSSVQWVTRVTHSDVTTVMAGPQSMLKAQFTLDPSQMPKTIDYLNLAGGNKGKKQQGIYAFEGGLLQICVAAPGVARPAEFRSVKGDGRTFTVWKKA